MSRTKIGSQRTHESNIVLIDPRVNRAQFVKRGDFNAYHHIWWHMSTGYFVTGPDGRTFNGIDLTYRGVPLITNEDLANATI